MKRILFSVFSAGCLCIALVGSLHARGFGGGGFHGGGMAGGFHGGGMAGGFHGGMGGGGFGGGGMGGYGGRLPGMGASGFGGGGFGGGGAPAMGGYGGRLPGMATGLGGLGGGGFAGPSAGGFNGGGGGMRFNGAGLEGNPFAGGNLPRGGFDAARLPNGFGGRGAGGIAGAGGFGGGAPNAARLNSFLGLPSDSGISAAGRNIGNPFVGNARGLSPAGNLGDTNVWNGPNGATIAHGEGPGGHASGTVVEGPDGGAAAHGQAGQRGAVVGPNGAAAGERGASGTVIKGPDGGTFAHGQAGARGAAVGPHGAIAGGREASGTVIKGPGGNSIAHGQAASRGFYARAGAGTWHASAADLRVQGNYVNANFGHWNAYGRDWYRRYPNAWWARGFAAGVWAATTWDAVNSWFGVTWPAMYYDYGNNIYYDDGNVYLDGQQMATADEYYQSAAQLAQSGAAADVPNENSTAAGDQPDAASADPSWLPLGVFEAIEPNQKSSDMTFQLAVNKDGVIRGNYYNTGDNNVQEVEGAVDKETQRVTWFVANRKNVIFDTGLYNLTKDEATVLVHESADKTEQWTLVRLKQDGASQTASQPQQ